jgi:hypothetical protein
MTLEDGIQGLRLLAKHRESYTTTAALENYTYTEPSTITAILESPESGNPQ